MLICISSHPLAWPNGCDFTDYITDRSPAHPNPGTLLGGSLDTPPHIHLRVPLGLLWLCRQLRTHGPAPLYLPHCPLPFISPHYIINTATAALPVALCPTHTTTTGKVCSQCSSTATFLTIYPRDRGVLASNAGEKTEKAGYVVT